MQEKYKELEKWVWKKRSKELGKKVCKAGSKKLGKLVYTKGSEELIECACRKCSVYVKKVVRNNGSV